MSTNPTVLSNFIRKWNITIVTGVDAEGKQSEIKASSSDFGINSLRATFDIFQFGYRAFWYGDIVIYNFDAAAIDKVLTEGMQVTVSAGYENGNYGQIFVGRLFQSFVERENVTDYKTTLHCIAGRPEMVANFISFNLDGKPTPEQIIQQAARSAPSKLSLAYIAATLTSEPLPRGYVCFSDPAPFFDVMAKDNDLLWWFDGESLNMSDLNSPDPNEITISPPALQGGTTPGSGTLIGTPQQTQDGCVLRVLLDPRLRVKLHPVQIKLDMSSMQFLKQVVGQRAFLDQTGKFVVGGVRHYGDTRGNDWYSEAICYSTVSGKLAMLAAPIKDIAKAANDRYTDQGN